MLDRKAFLTFARNYVTRHPEELVRAAKNVALARVGLPLELVRFLVSQLSGRKAPRNVVVEAVPPGIRFAATVNVMRTDLRAGATLFVDRVRISPTEMRFEVRLTDVLLEVLSDGDSPLAALIKSGALDLSKPGNLVSFMPKSLPSLVEAKDDRIVFDLLRDPKLAKKASRIVAMLTPVLSIKSIETESDHLDVYLDWFPDGIGTALAVIREQL
jgi:hypothetical protein